MTINVLFSSTLIPHFCKVSECVHHESSQKTILLPLRTLFIMKIEAHLKTGYLLMLLLFLNVGVALGQGWVNEYDMAPGYNLLNGGEVHQLQNGNLLVFGNWQEGIGISEYYPYYFIIDENGVQLDAVYFEDDYVSMGGIYQFELDTNEDIYMLSREPSTITLVKINQAGDLIWEYEATITTNDFSQDQLLLTSDGGALIAGKIGQDNDVQLLKVDALGQLEWSQVYENDNPILMLYGLEIATDGTYWLSTSQGATNWGTSPVLIQFDAQGMLLGEQDFPSLTAPTFLREFEVLSDGSFALAGRMGIGGSFSLEIAIVKINTDGTVDWTKLYNEPNNVNHFIDDIVENTDGSITIASRTSVLNEPAVALDKIDANGDFIWERVYFFLESGSYLNDVSLTTATDGGYYVGTNGNGLNDATQLFDTLVHVLRTDDLGNLFDGNISGNVFNDLDDDCSLSTGEVPITNWLVSAEGTDGELYYGISNNSGNYDIGAPADDYIVTVHTPNIYWEACLNPFLGEVITGETLTADFPMQAVVDCPALAVDIATGILRRCFDNRYYLNYCNHGTLLAEDAYIEVTFPAEFQVNSASLPWTSANAGVYTFDVGDLDLQECGSFYIDVELDPNCDLTVLGQTHCVEAHIYPDTLCLPDLGDWDGSSIELSAECIGGMINFQIENVGDDMDNQLNYIVIEDNIMYDGGNFQLNAAQAELVPISANGSTFRLEAEQSPGHPGNNMPSIMVEGCDPDGDGEYSIGFVNQFPENDGDPFLSIHCAENIGSYDPNDKMGFPIGYGEEHFILPNQDIEYLIRFQNIGTDTAFNVVVVDSIRPALDITSLQVGASSFPYGYEVFGTGIIKFTFNNINLPPEMTDEAASQGFVKFRIAQQPNLPNNTVIHNDASIYFDFNAPIITNLTDHTVMEEFVIVDVTEVKIPEASVEVFPNPTAQQAVFEIKGINPEGVDFKIYDSLGKEVSQHHFATPRFTFNRGNLPAGVYFYQIEGDGALIATGKLMIQ